MKLTSELEMNSKIEIAIKNEVPQKWRPSQESQRFKGYQKWRQPVKQRGPQKWRLPLNEGDLKNKDKLR